MQGTDAPSHRPPEGVDAGQGGPSVHAGPASLPPLGRLPGTGALSPEERLVLLLARIAPPGSHLAAARALVAGDGFDWAAAYRLAWRLWVHPLFARAVLGDEEGLEAAVPDEVRRALVLCGFAARTRWSVYQREMAGIFGRWHEEGIEPVLLKGAAHALTLVPPEARLLNDLDVWVPPERFDDAAEALRAAGFRRWSVDGGDARENRLRMSGWTFSRHVGGSLGHLVVDLHYRLHHRDSPFALDADACAAAGHAAEFAGVPVRVFRREDALVHLGTQVGTDTGVKLQTVTDAVALLSPAVEGAPRPSPPPRADLLEARAREARAEAPTAVLLRWARAMGAPVPGDTVRRLEAAAPHGAPARGLLVDARAVHPDFRLPAIVQQALGATFLPPGPERRATLGRIPLEVGVRQRRAGAAPAARWWTTLRSVPLVAASSLLLQVVGALARRASPLARRVTGRLWKRLPEDRPPEPFSDVEIEPLDP